MLEGVNYSRAIKLFDEALMMDNNRTKLFTLKAVCHIHNKDFTVALECVTKLINISNPVLIGLFEP